MIQAFILGLCLVLGLSQSLWATTQPSLALYFEPGSDKLTAQGRKSLDSLANIAKLYPAYELSIWAYPDEKGDYQASLNLAQRRSKAVAQYLDTKEVKPSRTELQGLALMALIEQWDAEERRRRSRRVDLFFIPLTPNSMADLFEFFRQTQTQVYELNSARPQVIFGRKGGVIRLPANCFVDAVGRPIEGKVRLELIEAYSFKDMIYNNLHTTAIEGKNLQTGGMMYLEARDSKNQKLKLAPGQALELSFPKPEGGYALFDKKGERTSADFPQDMQVFIAEREPRQAAQPLQWIPTNQPFVTAPSSSNLSANASIRGLRNLRELLPDSLRLGVLPALPEALFTQAPSCPEVGSLFQNEVPEIPSLAEIQAQNPRKFLERRKKYKARTQAIYDSRAKGQQVLLKANAERQAKYQGQKQAYETCMQPYWDYIARRSEREAALLGLQTSYRGWAKNLAKVQNQNQTAQMLLGEMGWESQCRLLEAERLRLLAEAQKQGKQIFVRDLQNLDFSPPADLERWVQALNTELKVFWNSVREPSKTIGQNFDLLAKPLAENEGFETQYAQVYKLYPSLIALPPATDSFNRALSRLLPKIPQDLQRFLVETNQKVEALSLAQIALSTDLTGLVQAKVSGLQWVNCDRFWDIPADKKRPIKVKHPEFAAGKGEVAWFVVLPDYKSVMAPFSAGDATMTHFQGIPTQAKAHLIGLHVSEAAGVMIHHSQDQEIDKYSAKAPEFKPANLKEFEDLLESLAKGKASK